MTRDDYEEQKRRLAEQRRVLIELAESAYQQQVRALDTVWRMMSGEGAGELPAAVPAAAVAPPAAPARRRLRAGELYNDIVDALPHLPDPFIHSDIVQALGYETDRGSLYRTLLELRGNGHLAVVEVGSGTRPARYRWTHARVAAAEP